MNKRKTINFFTPAHYGKPLSFQNKRLGKEIYRIDHPYLSSNVITHSENKISRLLNTKHSFYLTNGTSQGILISLLACSTRHKEIFLPRNIHLSVISGLIVSGLKPRFIASKDKFFCYSLKDIKFAFKKHPQTKALLLINPSYNGCVLDLKKIGKFCKKKHIDFIVDEAHGSLFPFNSNLPTSALQIDCDFVLHSAHKYLGGLVQTAFLHLPRTSSYSPIQVSRLKKVFESTTKSNLLLASLEEITNKNFLVFLRSKIDLLLNECKKIRESSKSLSNIQIVSFQSNDPLKFYIFSPKISTQKLAILFLEKGFDFEYYDDNGILFIIPINIPVISLRKFYRVLTLIDSEITLMAASKAKQKFEYNNPIIKMTPREAFSAAKVMYIPLKDAIGRISADLIAKCPPGIPLLLPGELITKWHMDAIGKEQLVTIVDSKNIN